MTITFFNRCYWPDSEATGQLLTELCEFLASQNLTTRVVVGQPNFADKSETFVASGSQSRNRVEIVRLEHSQLPKGKRFGRIRNLVSFTLAVRSWLRSQKIAPPTINDSESHSVRDVWVCETDPFLLPLVVGPAARKANAKLIYYLQDIYPDVAVAVGVTRNHAGIKLLRNQLKKQYEQADAIIVLDEDMKDRLVGWGLPADKFHIVPNWMDCSKVTPIKTANAFRHANQLDDSFVVMHSGNMGMTQRLDILVDAMKQPDVPNSVRLLLVGNGAKRESLEQQVAQSGALGSGLDLAEQVRFFDYQPRESLAESLSAADLHVVSMDEAITGCLAPSKLYGILASGTPILAIVPKGNAVWRFVAEHQLGWCVEPGDQVGIARAIREAAEAPRERLLAMGAAGRDIAEKLFDKNVCCRQFQEILEQVASGVNGMGASLPVSRAGWRLEA
ncbi:glycosyltransferase family 4 protein [Pirellulaceae bacterium SH501]